MLRPCASARGAYELRSLEESRPTRPTLTAIAALVGSLTLSTAVDARGFRGGGWHGGGSRGGYYGRGYGYGRGWGYGGWGGYYGGGCWNWWYGRWVWVC